MSLPREREDLLADNCRLADEAFRLRGALAALLEAATKAELDPFTLQAARAALGRET
jgi:hypothetical protein